VALEATFHSYAIAGVLRPFVRRVVLSNPLQTQALAQAKIKPDKVDARVLSQLLRCDYLPEVWQPDEATHRLRRLTHRRAPLVAERTRLKNRLHSVLAGERIVLPCDDLFSQKGLVWLRSVEMDPLDRQQIESDLRLMEATEKELQALEQTLARPAWEDERVKLLMTLPGVDYAVAQALLAALGEISRFADGEHAASYLGLVPSTHQSGEPCYHGPIPRHGNGKARRRLIQAAPHVAAHPGPLGVFFRRLLKKKNRNVAVVATARKLVVIAWQMRTHNEPYRYAQPQPTKTKRARLRVRVSGQKRASGTKKGEARSARYGTGESVRRIPALPEVLDGEELPPTQPLNPAEERMRAAMQVAEYVRSLGTPSQRPRRSGTRSSRAEAEPSEPAPTHSVT